MPKNQRRVIQSAVLKTLKKHKGNLIAVLSAYPTEEVVWQIPPLISGELNGVKLNHGPELVNRSMDRKEFARIVNLFKHNGWKDGRLGRAVRKHLKEFEDTPWIFDKETRSAGKFAVEFACALGSATNTHFVTQGLTLGFRFSAADEVVGVVGGVVHGTDVTVSPDELYRWSLLPRGDVVGFKFGVYDRIYHWLSYDFSLGLESDALKQAVGSLKLCDYKSEEEAFGDLLRQHALNDYLPIVRGPYPAPTLEDVAEARDAWLNTGSTPEKALQNLFDSVVPKIFDSEKFKRLFKVIPVEDIKLTANDVSKIDKGLNAFLLECAKLRSGT